MHTELRVAAVPLLWMLVAFASGCTCGGGGGDDAGTACTIGGTPVQHTGNITASQTWASGIHVVPATLHVQSGALLTIERCSQVRLGKDVSIIVDATATGLTVNGLAASPVTFVRDDAANAWGNLEVITPATATLSYTTLDRGGGTLAHGQGADFEGATLVGKGDSTPPTVPVVFTIDHLTISASTGLGAFLQSARFDPASTKLTITGAGWYPVYGGIGSAASLPDGAYTGNAVDQILLQTISAAVYDDTAPLRMDARLRDLGVPYRVGSTSSSIRVGSGLSGDPSALLIIDPNVTLLFTPQGNGGRSQLLVSGQSLNGIDAVQGALQVQGSAAAPVIFDTAGASPVAGDWQGLYFSRLVDPRTSVTFAHINHAGGNSGTVGVCESSPGSGQNSASCAIVISVSAAPAAFLKNTSIVDSGLCGVYREWKIADVDFTATNQFTRVPGCIQSLVPNAQNACPSTHCLSAP